MPINPVDSIQASFADSAAILETSVSVVRVACSTGPLLVIAHCAALLKTFAHSAAPLETNFFRRFSVVRLTCYTGDLLFPLIEVPHWIVT